MATYWQRGESIDYKNTGSDVIKAGDVVDLDGRIGIAGCDIAPDNTGSLHVIGVFRFKKPSGVAIDLGEPVEVDAATGEAVAPGGGVVAGWAVEPAAASDETVLVKIG